MFVSLRQAFVLADGLGRPSLQRQTQEKIKSSPCVGANSGGEPPHSKSARLATWESYKAKARKEFSPEGVSYRR